MLESILDKYSWQITVLLLGVCLIFAIRNPLIQFINRITKVGKDGISTSLISEGKSNGIDKISTPQVIEIIRLYQGYQYGKFLEMSFDLIDKHDEGKDYVFDQHYLIEQADGIRKESREHLSIFETPHGNLGKFLDDNFPADEFNKDINKILELIRSDKKSPEKRHLIVKYMGQRKASLADRYRKNMK